MESIMHAPAVQAGPDLDDHDDAGELVPALPSRTGASIPARIDRDRDGAVTVLSRDEHGWRSAHRDHARRTLGAAALWRMNNLTWINRHGVRVRLTRWHTEAFRVAPLDN
jgi:hypothetical protein